MPKYVQISDMLPIAEKIMAAYGSPQKLNDIFYGFIQEILADYGDTDQAIKYYIAILALFDGCAGTPQSPIEMTRAIHDGIIKAHIDVLRRECVKYRQNVNLNFGEIATMANIAMAHTCPQNCGQIMGIRKTTRITPGVGVLSSWLSEEEMHAAAMTVCAWIPHTTSVLDGGFIAGYSNKFDIQDKGVLRVFNENINQEPGLTPAEYKIICRSLVPHVIKTMGEIDGTVFLETIFKRALEQIDDATVKRLLVPFAEHCGLNVKVTSKDEWLRVFLSAKKGATNRGWSIIPATVDVEYGMELCYPLAPLVSWIWVEEINQLSGKKAIKHRFGYVDIDSLFHSKYNTRSAEGDNGVNRGYGLFPMLSCSFIAAPNVTCAENISGCAENNVMFSAYTWKAQATDSNDPIFYTLDDLFKGGIFNAGTKYSLTVDMKDSVCLPSWGEYYEADIPDVKMATFPEEIVREHDFVLIVFAQGKASENNWGWGTPLTKSNAKKILPFLEFNSGQELDTNEQNKLRKICRVTKNKSKAVTNFLANTGKKYILFKIPSF